MIIRYPNLSEVEELASVLFSAFYKDFSYLYGTDYEFGRKLFKNFYKKVIREKDLRNFLVVVIDNKIIAAAHLDFEDPKLISFFPYFLKMNLHFFRSYTKFGFKRAFKIMLGMYWFFFEDFNTNSGYIKLLGVLPEYQNLKIGTKVLQVIEKITRHRHLGSMTLDVTYEDLPARHLYRKMGFTRTKDFHNSFMKYLNGIEGAISMEKRLTCENRR
jgi:ribosomal protein S18 acetylase RimI-like enzyme